MRRAFVGFSSPIGYDYRVSVNQTKNDNERTSPNATLYGSTALFLLYDEIWFACESLCPANMRHLSYVHFLDQEFQSLQLAKWNFKEQITNLYNAHDNDRAFQMEGQSVIEHREFCRTNYGIPIDDHRGVVSFAGQGIKPKIGIYQSIIDCWLISRFQEKCFHWVLNPFTATFTLTGMQPSDPIFDNSLRHIEISDKLVTLKNIVDVSGTEGPYHPIIDELRNDNLLKNYRIWLDQVSQQSNVKEVCQVVHEVDEKITEFTDKALLKYVEATSLTKTLVSVSKGSIMDALPGSATLVSISEQMQKYHHRQENGWKTFIARARIKTKNLI